MRVSAILSTVMTAICVILSVWLFVISKSNTALQADLQRQQQTIQNKQQEFQLRQQKFQAQQEQINSGMQLAQQVGPAVLRDLGALALQNNNEKIKKLLSKYGVEVKEGEQAPQP